MRIEAPRGSLLNCVFPASVRTRTRSGWYIHSALSAALFEVLPTRVMAPNGLMGGILAYGKDDAGHQYYAHFFDGGGMGAGASTDGNRTLIFPSSAPSVPVEMFEVAAPVLIHEKEFVCDSAGAGRYRGRAGQRVSLSRLPGWQQPVVVNFWAHGMRVPPFGLEGGGPATPPRVFINDRELDRREFLSQTEGFHLDDDATICTSEIAGAVDSVTPPAPARPGSRRCARRPGIRRKRRAGLRTLAKVGISTGGSSRGALSSARASDGMVVYQPLTSFIGRERETARVSEWLRRADVRLVTLTGPGGIGKTRLGLRVAAGLRGEFADGAVFVSLAPLATADLVSPTIAQALGVAAFAGGSLVDSMTAHLKDKQLLLVLDNFEHVGEAAPIVSELLLASPRLKVLATSRVPMRLGGEHTLLVPPMALPDGGAATAAILGESDSVKLFVERAQAAKQDFVLTNDNAPSVAEICRLVDGLPLGIELAAARVRGLSPRALLGRMAPSLPLLTDGPRDAPARQQTLRNTIAWSYDLLDPADQMLFQRLAVFRGCTLDVAEAVCSAPAPSPGSTSIAARPLKGNVLDGVVSLVEKNLLCHEELPDGEPWYVMLETIREFALERLTESGEADVILRRHILHYLQLAESREQQNLAGQEGSWHARIEREHDNLRAALDCSVASGYVEPGFRLALALWWFWMVCGHLTEGRARFAALFARFPLRDVTGPRAAQRARALGAAGTLASVQGEFTVARTMQEEGVAIWRKLGDLAGVAAGLEGLALSAATSGDYPTARECTRECLAIARELDDKQMIAQALYLSANVLHEQGELKAARQSAQESVAILEETHARREVDHSFMAPHRLTLAVVLQELGDYDAAQKLTESTLSEYREYGEWRALAVALANLGSIATARRDFATARQRLSESLAIQEEMHDLAGTAFVLERFVALAAVRRQHERALTLAGAAAAIREAVGVPLPPRGRTRLDEALSGPRRALGETIAAKAWTVGRSMPAAEAITFARAPVDAIRGPAVGPGEPLAVRNGLSSPILSAREREVAALIARGRTNRSIAAELVIAEGTAALHVAHILNKLGFSSRSQIAAWVVENRVLSK